LAATYLTHSCLEVFPWQQYFMYSPFLISSWSPSCLLPPMSGLMPPILVRFPL
jgi:hypothetical protein